MLLFIDSIPSKMRDFKSIIFVIIFVAGFLQCYSVSTQYTFQNVTVHLKVLDQIQSWRKIFIPHATSARSFLKATDAKVKVILFKKQRIPVLFRNSFSEVTAVRKINLSGCNVEEVQPGFLSNQTRILEFDLSGNKIRDIQYGVFSDLDITRLYLNNNKIFEISSEAFSNMKNLEMIILANNRIKTWDSSWFLKTPVRHVDFSSNSLETIPKGAFDYFKDFQKKTYGEFYYINFNDNSITKLNNNSLPEVDTLWFLFLERNSIEEIESGFFYGLNKMEALKLGNNRLKQFDNELIDNLNLKYLKIDENSINDIDVNITEILNIENNPLSPECRREWDERKKRDRVSFERYFYDN